LVFLSHVRQSAAGFAECILIALSVFWHIRSYYRLSGFIFGLSVQ